MRGKAEQRITLTVEFDSLGEWEMVRNDLADLASSTAGRKGSLSLLAEAMDSAREDADRLQHPEHYS